MAGYPRPAAAKPYALMAARAYAGEDAGSLDLPTFPEMAGGPWPGVTRISVGRLIAAMSSHNQVPDAPLRSGAENP
ncbi:hypothetical protein GCM10028796_12940 [Ramlibacter monticola]